VLVDCVCRDSIDIIGDVPSGSSVCGQWLLRDKSSDQYMPHNITGLSHQITLSVTDYANESNVLFAKLFNNTHWWIGEQVGILKPLRLAYKPQCK